MAGRREEEGPRSVFACPAGRRRQLACPCGCEPALTRCTRRPSLCAPPAWRAPSCCLPQPLLTRRAAGDGLGVRQHAQRDQPAQRAKAQESLHLGQGRGGRERRGTGQVGREGGVGRVLRRKASCDEGAQRQHAAGGNTQPPKGAHAAAAWCWRRCPGPGPCCTARQHGYVCGPAARRWRPRPAAPPPALPAAPAQARKSMPWWGALLLGRDISSCAQQVARDLSCLSSRKAGAWRCMPNPGRIHRRRREIDCEIDCDWEEAPG